MGYFMTDLDKAYELSEQAERQKQIEMERDSYTFDSRYTVVNFRDIWG